MVGSFGAGQRNAKWEILAATPARVRAGIIGSAWFLATAPEAAPKTTAFSFSERPTCSKM
ncbi:hypothetical protein [Hydrogenophaga sp.]|uniref:hypothetical protein n=1 Tax=Hydrogenophaga sp. TaxID=1904254 RepID=UPI001999233B|nr:hypothetical protein [Hydrogenophaga sp.]MBD3894222.1 hypothetical protein [Hydrogenophaga sp.]